MKRIKSVIRISAFLFLFSSCGVSENEKMIVGNWSGVEWLAGGQPSALKAADTHFTFDANGKYTYEYPGTKQQGTYKVENDMLFTTPSGQQEMMVKIAKLTKDSLVFNMDREGAEEMLTLVRK